MFVKITGERWWRMGKKCLDIVFQLTRRSWVHGKKNVFCHPTAWATSYCLLPDTFWLRTFKNAFKVSTVNFTNLLSPPSIVKKVRCLNRPILRTWRLSVLVTWLVQLLLRSGVSRLTSIHQMLPGNPHTGTWTVTHFRSTDKEKAWKSCWEDFNLLEI